MLPEDDLIEAVSPGASRAEANDSLDEERPTLLLLLLASLGVSRGASL